MHRIAALALALSLMPFSTGQLLEPWLDWGEKKAQSILSKARDRSTRTRPAGEVDMDMLPLTPETVNASARVKAISDSMTDEDATEFRDRYLNYTSEGSIIFLVKVYRSPTRGRSVRASDLLVQINARRVFSQEPKLKPKRFVRAESVQQVSRGQFLVRFPLNEDLANCCWRYWLEIHANDELLGNLHIYRGQFKKKDLGWG